VCFFFHGSLLGTVYLQISQTHGTGGGSVDVLATQEKSLDVLNQIRHPSTGPTFVPLGTCPKDLFSNEIRDIQGTQGKMFSRGRMLRCHSAAQQS
jgi:hypothetical protein